MRKEASLEQWKELYFVACELDSLSPWSYLKELDLVTILLPDIDEPFYCNFLNEFSDGKQVSIYSGFNSLNNFMKILSSKDMPSSQLIRYEESTIITFGDRQELTTDEYKLIKEMGFKFRGKGKWIYFRSIKPGYAPYILDEQEVIYTIRVLKELVIAAKNYIEEMDKINFCEGNTLFRWFNREKDSWETIEAPLLLGEKVYNNVILNDKETMNKLLNSQRIPAILEVDIVFLESIIEDTAFDRPIIPRLCIIANHDDGCIIDQWIVKPSDDVIQDIISIVINFVLRNGRPKSIIVRDDFSKSVLRNICKKMDVKLIINESLMAIDSVFSGMFSEIH